MNIFKIFKKNKRLARTISKRTESLVITEWRNINILLTERSPSQLRQALISADKTLDNVLRDLFEGDTMAERLRNSEKRFDKDTYNKIWKAHKLRNTLVHEVGFEPPHYVLTESVEDLRKGVSSLGIRV